MTNALLLVLLPVAVLALAWATGRAIAGRLPGPRPGEAAAMFAGLAAMLAVLSNLSFFGIMGTRPGALVVLGVAAVAIFWGRKNLRAPDWHEIALFAAVVAVTLFHYLWPLLRDPTADIVLMYAGDFNQYVAMGSWLQGHPITVPADLDMDYNTLQSNLLDHQRTNLRIGALLFLGFFTTLGFTQVALVFSLYCGFILALQAVAVGLLARRLVPQLPLWASALAGLLYGLSPTANWAAYGSFVPQTLGLAFLVAAVASLVGLLESPEEATGWRARMVRGVPTGLLFFAAWSCYPEAVPLAALIVLCYLLLSFGRSMAQPATLGRLAVTGLGVLVTWILASPLNFAWGVRGFLVQLKTMAHGGPQEISLWTLFGTAVGAIQQPLIGGAASFNGEWFQYASIAACVVMAIGIAWLFTTRQRALPLAATIAAAFLFTYVRQRYSFERNGTYPAWEVMLTWNLYKAAVFLAPFAVAAGVVGVLALAQRYARNAGMAVASLLLAGLLLSIAVRQDTWAAPQMSMVRVPADARAFMAHIPPGRLLVDVHDGDPMQERYHRYAIYSLLGDRPFLSTRDGQPTHVYALFDDNMADMRKRLLSVPLEYVLTDRAGDYSRFPVVGRAGAFVLVDTRGKDFQVNLRDYGAPPVTLVSFGRTPAAREVTAEVFGLPPDRRVLYNAFGKTQAFEKQARAKLPVLLTVPPSGGLAQFVFEPVMDKPPGIAIREGFGEVDVPARIDLLELAREAEIAGDASGARLVMHKSADGVRLDMPKFGTSRLRIAADLYPGEYVLQAELGEVSVAEQDPAGFGAFLGEENDKPGTAELKPLARKRHEVRILVKQPRKAFFVIGFGAWGKARGSLEIKSLVLVRRNAAA